MGRFFSFNFLLCSCFHLVLHRWKDLVISFRVAKTVFYAYVRNFTLQKRRLKFYVEYARDFVEFPYMPNFCRFAVFTILNFQNNHSTPITKKIHCDRPPFGIRRFLPSLPAQLHLSPIYLPSLLSVIGSGMAWHPVCTQSTPLQKSYSGIFASVTFIIINICIAEETPVFAHSIYSLP